MAKVKKNTLITTEGLVKAEMLQVLVNKYVEYKATEIILLKKGVIKEDTFEAAVKVDKGVTGDIEALVKEYSKKLKITSTDAAENTLSSLLVLDDEPTV